MTATDVHGDTFAARAINEVSMLRQSYQAAKLRILIDGQERMRELIADGLLVCTPAGSMVVMVRLPCGEGTSLEYNRSLGSGYVSNKEEREKVGWKE